MGIALPSWRCDLPSLASFISGRQVLGWWSAWGFRSFGGRSFLFIPLTTPWSRPSSSLANNSALPLLCSPGPQVCLCRIHPLHCYQHGLSKATSCRVLFLPIVTKRSQPPYQSWECNTALSIRARILNWMNEWVNFFHSTFIASLLCAGYCYDCQVYRMNRNKSLSSWSLHFCEKKVMHKHTHLYYIIRL